MRPAILFLLFSGCISSGEPCGPSTPGAELVVVGEEAGEVWFERGQQGTQHLTMSMYLPEGSVADTAADEQIPDLVDRARIEASLWDPVDTWARWDVGGGVFQSPDGLYAEALPFILFDVEPLIGRKVCVSMTVDPITGSRPIVAHELLTVAWMPGHEDGLPPADSGAPVDTGAR